MKRASFGTIIQTQIQVFKSVHYSSFWAYLLESFSRTQVLSLVLIATYLKDDYSTSSDPIVDLINYTTIIPNLNFNSSKTKTTLGIILIGYMVIYTLTILLTLILQLLAILPKQLSRWMSISLTFCNKILICPLILGIFRLLQNQENCLDSKMSFECQIGIQITSLMLITIIILLSIFKEILFSRKIDCKDRFSTKTCTESLIHLLHKIIVSIVLGFTINQGPNVCGSILNVVILVLDLYCLVSFMPAFHPMMIKIMNVFTTISFAIALCLLPNLYQKTRQTSLLIYIGAALSSKIMCIYINSVFREVLNLNGRNTFQLLALPRLVQLSFENGITLDILKIGHSEQILTSFGRASIYQVDIPQNNRQESLEEYKKRVWNKVLNYLQSMQTKFPNNKQILLMICQIKYKRLQRVAGTYLQLKQVQEQMPTLDLQAEINIFVEKMEQKIRFSQTSFDNEMAIRFFEYYKIIDNFQKLAQKEIEKQVELWRYFCMEKGTSDKICKKIIEISKILLKVQQQINIIGEIMDQFHETSLVYGAYLIIVKERPDGKRWIERFYVSHRKRENNLGVKWFDYHNPNQALLISSVEQRTSGCILESSHSLRKMFNIREEDITKYNISDLLPHFMKDGHEKALSLFRNADTPLKTKRSIARTSNGEFFEVEVRLKLSPTLQKGLHIISLIRRLTQNQYMIFLDDKEKVIEFSNLFQKIFQFRTEKFGEIISNYRVNITNTDEFSNYEIPVQSFNDPEQPIVHTSKKQFNSRESLCIGKTIDNIQQDKYKKSGSFVIFEYMMKIGEKVNFQAKIEKHCIFGKDLSIYRMDIETFKNKNPRFEYIEEIIIVSKINNQIGFKNEGDLESEFAENFPEEQERIDLVRKVRMKETFSVQREIRKDIDDATIIHSERDQEVLVQKKKKRRLSQSTQSMVGSSIASTIRQIRNIQESFQNKKSARPYILTRYLCFFTLIMIQALLIIYFTTAKSTLSLIDNAGIVSVEISIKCLWLLWVWREGMLYYANLMGYKTIGDQSLSKIKTDLYYYNTEWRIYADHLYQDINRVVSQGSEVRQFFGKYMVSREYFPIVDLDEFDGVFDANSAYFEILNISSQELLNREGWYLKILNFTINDILIWSNDAEIKAKAALLQTINSRNSTILLPIVFCVVLLTILVTSLGALAYYIHKRLKILFIALENIKPETVKQRIDKLVDFKNRFDRNLQDPGFINEILQLLEGKKKKIKVKADKELDRKKFRPQDNNYMAPINVRLFLSFIGGFIVCFTLGIVLFTNYTSSLGYQQTYYSKVKKMFTVFDILYNNPFTSSNLISWILFYNNTEMMVQSETQQESFQFNLDALTQSEEELYDIFTDGTGNMQYPIAGPLLESNLCEFVEEYHEYCQQIANGRQFGLIDMINLQVQTMKNFEQLFLQNPVESKVQILLNMMEQTDNKQILVSLEANTYLQWYLYDQIHVIAESLIQNEINDAILYSWISWIMIILLSLTTFYYFNYYDTIKFRLISLLPLEIIQQNRILQFYFINELGAVKD